MRSREVSISSYGAAHPAALRRRRINPSRRLSPHRSSSWRAGSTSGRKSDVDAVVDGQPDTVVDVDPRRLDASPPEVLSDLLYPDGARRSKEIAEQPDL